MNIPSQHIASIDIDAQYTFTSECPDELPVPDATQIVCELNAQAAFADYRIGSKDAHSATAHWVANEKNPPLTPINAPNMDTHWPVHAVPGTKGFELIAGLPAITEYDFFVWKGIEPDLHPYGICYHDFAERLSTGLVEYLHARDIRLVIAGGLATDICVKASVLQLIKAGFNVIVNLAACRGLSAESTRAAVQQMQQAGAIIIHTTEELLTITITNSELTL